MRLLHVRFVDALPLRTSRLTLRRLVASDIPPLADMLSDPIVMQHSPRPLTRAEARGWLHRNTERYRQDGTALFAVCAGSTWIGTCGLVRRHIDGLPVLELGYHLRREVWGLGYAMEAAAACVELALGTTEPDAPVTLASLIRPGNHASQRVVRRLGFRVERIVVHAGVLHERWNVTPARFAVDLRRGA